MKALKSKLASQLLADPKASDELLSFLLSKPTRPDSPNAATTGHFLIRNKDGQAVQISATVVPKASNAA